MSCHVTGESNVNKEPKVDMKSSGKDAQVFLTTASTAGRLQQPGSELTEQ